jgi:hypothetical protein
MELLKIVHGDQVRWCTLVNFSYSGGRGRRIVNSRLTWAKLVGLYLKNQINSKGGIAQMVECLPRMYKALSSVPCTEKKVLYEICFYRICRHYSYK